MKKCRFVVSGVVQGVGVRAATQRRAQSLGLVGWARNLADGAVEVVAGGDEAAVEDLAAWLERGPRAAQVESVRRLPAHGTELSEGMGFQVR